MNENIVILIAVLIMVGCDSQPVSPPNSGSSKISGETKLIKSVDSGTTKQLANGGIQIRNKILIFEDSATNNELSGLRNIVFNHNYDKNNLGHCYGTFSIESDLGLWEGDWTGTKTLDGITIRAKGYNLDDRDQSCEWKYYFPSSLEGNSGTYSAVINTNRY